MKRMLICNFMPFGDRFIFNLLKHSKYQKFLHSTVDALLATFPSYPNTEFTRKTELTKLVLIYKQ